MTAEYLSLGFKPQKMEDIEKLAGFLQTLKSLGWLDLQKCDISNSYIEVLNTYAVGETGKVIHLGETGKVILHLLHLFSRNVILVYWTCLKTLNAVDQR